MNAQPSYVTLCASGNYVETWYDSKSRVWIIQTKQPAKAGDVSGGYQIEDCDTSVTRMGAYMHPTQSFHAFRVEAEGGPAADWKKKPIRRMHF